MHELVAVVALALLMGAPVAADTQREQQVKLLRSVHAHCAASWPGNEKLQKDCIESQLSASDAFAKLANGFRVGSEERALVVRCFERWVDPDRHRADFRMALQCAQGEVETHKSRQ